MEQPWWVYTVVAVGCLIAYLGIRYAETKLKDDMNIVKFVIGIIGVFSAFQAAGALKIFG